MGAVEKDSEVLKAEHKALFETANAAELQKKEKHKKRGKNKISAKLRRKQKNVVDAQMLKLKEKQAADRVARAEAGISGGSDLIAAKRDAANGVSGSASASSFQGALSRFYKK